MAAILEWFATYVFAGLVGEAFKKATIFVTFNIVLSFIISYISGHGVSGITVFGLGDTVSQLLSQNVSPMVAYVLDCFYVVQGLFLCLNAMLARFAYRLVLKAL